MVVQGIHKHLYKVPNLYYFYVNLVLIIPYDWIKIGII